MDKMEAMKVSASAIETTYKLKKQVIPYKFNTSIVNAQQKHKFITNSILLLVIVESLFLFINLSQNNSNKFHELLHSPRGHHLLIDSSPIGDPSQSLNHGHAKPRSYFSFIQRVDAFEETERLKLKNEAKQMFYHAYQSYLNTYPADEILPISCQGRFRQNEDSNDIDDSIGNFSLTLVDSLDTLVMMGDIPEFDVALKRIINDLNFDMNIVVSVFETNIRMLGGLLSAHILAKSIQNQTDHSIRHVDSASRHTLDWYDSELLDLAENLGRRLLPAFDSKTGIPYSRVNLKHGMESNELRSSQETCTACAGSLILEFATLSRLTGDPVFEDKARGALDSLWDRRHRGTDLMGTVLNVETGEWVRRESGVGAGSDSYYEYLMKAYILLGDTTYLDRFNKHYSSVMQYISRGPFLIDVHMHRPNKLAKGFMDALSAFWPGLQVLKGDLKAAISTHAMFNEVIRKHSYLPEAFTTDLQVYWANHQMRPEFLESTYFLHRATNDDYYLEIGKDALNKLQDLKVDCGFAGLKDVRTGVHDDRMSSFVLAETLKYLYLLFSHDNETHIDLDRFIFSTEGHFLPIDLSLMKPNLIEKRDMNLDHDLNDLELENPNEDFSRDSEEEIKEKKMRQTRLAIARLLIKMSTKFNQDKTVTSWNYFENACPSLEIQDMRNDGRYHPFLNRRLDGTDILSSSNLVDSESGVSYRNLVESVRHFTSTDPDYQKLAGSLGISLKVLPSGLVRLMFDGIPSSLASELQFGETNAVQLKEDDGFV